MRRRPRADFPRSYMTRGCWIDVVREKAETTVQETSRGSANVLSLGFCEVSTVNRAVRWIRRRRRARRRDLQPPRLGEATTSTPKRTCGHVLERIAEHPINPRRRVAAVARDALVADLVRHGLPDLSEPDSSRRGWAGTRSMRLTMRRTALALRRLGAALRQPVVLVSGAERYEGLVVT